MKTNKKIFTAFLLNLFFSIFELVGGVITGSVAILSDSLHDFGDATAICFSYCLEKKSLKKPDEKYTYGYQRYSVLGGFITTLILMLGSIFVIYGAVNRIINPIKIKYDGVIIVAIVGVLINFIATICTRGGNSLNRKAVNLHMIEDLAGYIVTLIGAIIMRFTGITLLDPIISIVISVFIFVTAIKNLSASIELFLEKVPKGISLKLIKQSLEKLEGVKNIHHVHVWGLDETTWLATLHAVIDGDICSIKSNIKEEMKKLGISHVTLETEFENENCNRKCLIKSEELGKRNLHCHHIHSHAHKHLESHTHVE